jgi:hypothetical protein
MVDNSNTNLTENEDDEDIDDNQYTIELNQDKTHHPRLYALTISMSLIVLIAGVVFSYNTTLDSRFPDFMESVLYFIFVFCWWIFPAIFLRWGSFYVGIYLKEKRKVWIYISLAVGSAISLIVLSAGLEITRYFLGFISEEEILFYIRIDVASFTVLFLIWVYFYINREKKTSV